MAAQRNVFHVVVAAALNPERDVLLGLPQEGTGAKQSFHRVPIRSSVSSTADDERIRVALLPGCTGVTQNHTSLRRLLLRFPESFVPSIHKFENASEGDRLNYSLGFALYDSMQGPTKEQTDVMQNVDALAQWIRLTMIQCDRIRSTLRLGSRPANRDQAMMVADMMGDVFVSRPLDAKDGGDAPLPGRGGKGGGKGNSGAGDAGGFSRPRTRYCYAKLVAPRTAPEIFQTYFYLPNGTEVPFETVLGWKNFKAEPYVEIEDVFVSKAVRSLQLKLRECIVTPAPERAQTRFSVAFPDRVCRQIDEAAAAAEGEAAAAVVHSLLPPAAAAPVAALPQPDEEERAAKRQRLIGSHLAAAAADEQQLQEDTNDIPIPVPAARTRPPSPLPQEPSDREEDADGVPVPVPHAGPVVTDGESDDSADEDNTRDEVNAQA